MNQEKEDRRVKYTKMFLREALLELMREKPIEKITPTELCRKADINRNTFYSHYTTPKDLLYEVEEELKSDIMKCIKFDKENSFGIPEICKAIKEHSELCKVILGNYGDRNFLLELMASVRDFTVSKWKATSPQADEMLLESLFVYCANGSVAVIGKWITEGMKDSDKKIAEVLEFANNAVILNSSKMLIQK